MACVALPHPTVVGKPVGCDVVASRVEELPTVEQPHFGGHQPHLWVFLERGDEGADPSLIGLCVVVEEDFDGSPGRPKSDVARPCEPPVTLQDDDPNLGVGGEDLERGVRGGVVDHQHLQLRVTLTAQAVQADWQVRGTVPVRDDDRDEGRHGAR